jgi:PKD repeat protein
MKRWKSLMFMVSAVSLPGLAGIVGTAGAAPSPTAVSRWSGQEAINRLGSRLPAVAAANSMSTAEFREHLLEDATLFVDNTDRLLYQEPVLPADVIAAGSAATVFDSTIPESDAFLLHSKPDATRVIFVDFDGYMMSGTAWNGSTGGDCYAEPYDSDNSPNTFSSAERQQIISVWRRMAEDFAPFDVNVTTEDPGDAAISRTNSSDVNYGSRVLITKSVTPCSNGKTIYASICGGGCGGIAYVGVYGSTGTTHDYYQPAFVFVNGVGTGAKNITEAASHEVGHNIGLNHDGTGSTGYYGGHGSWAPIMGVGYSKAISQWSRGEYSGANNTQDDFTVAGSNGLPLRADDHGNTTASATALAGTPATATGVISTRTDVDAFTINASAGPATISVAPVATSANLDVKLELRDSNGNLVASDDPASGSTNGDNSTGLGASVSVTLANGTYTILVDGVGFGDPLNTGYSDYGSVGFYQVSASYVGPDGQAPTASISATPTNGEIPLPVSFDGSASSDPEGATLTYAWNFGDGNSSTGVAPSHTYTTAGTYTATLTVTDDKGLSNTKSVTITASAPVRRIDLFSLTSTGVRGKSGSTVTATATVLDNNSTAVSGASVTGRWFNGSKVIRTLTATTNGSGVATFSSGNVKAPLGTVIRFCVTNITLTNGSWTTALFSVNSGTDCTTWTVR